MTSGAHRASRDFYDILGVARDADAAEIQRAYRTLARRYHPDINSDPGAEERFKELSEAYDVLSDPDSRARYDRFGHDFRRVSEEAARRPPPGAGTGGARPRAGAAGFGAGGFEEFDIGDLFGAGSGFFRRYGGAGPLGGADQEAEIEVSLAEAYRGGRRRVSLAGPGGSRDLDVTVPAGVTGGQRLRLAGQGGRGRDGGQPGDLYLVVRLLPSAGFRLDGRDVHTDLRLAPWEGALGAKVPLVLPTGERATVTVPPGTSSGRALRLAGRGLPGGGRGAGGDLFAHARIVVPPRLGPREAELFRELARESSFDPRGRS
ncbi:DnaJ domain-containing protein [Frankia sp. CNm7]|uniref:DnaJ domain-containing protein n=1 Tax=Frankia nepalensis TaxID=1836974 RepID=A0A937R5C5_9ACTN|nr:DnaJ C-terminal domain-containing protein [Frankia nepalensis]MBL7499031.1 DnaJ domain-containing protein [Frankia nepalensis]MBL7510173.1 DnaJ domain-containing protein [Frankia nepalensis]MBL7523147.1 DnaJ domain-containing protein [Frankia nepalensis]MBL7626043.1 DnaJ domain-containing protein [Frankia nepalensis]